MHDVHALALEQPQNMRERQRIVGRAHLEPDRRYPAFFRDDPELGAGLANQQPAKLSRVEPFQFAQNAPLLAAESERGFRMQYRNPTVAHQKEISK
ncbi:MAG: hypothetical protein ACYC7B_10845 [Burkholderiales bacterium]